MWTKKFKGSEVQVCLEYSKESTKAMVVEVEGVKDKRVRGEIKAISTFMNRIFTLLWRFGF